MQKFIQEYVRKGNRRVGTLVGFTSHNLIFIGWSMCNVKEGDKFDRQEGFNVAVQRAMGILNDEGVTVPRLVEEQLSEFQERCLKYFKGAVLASSIVKVEIKQTIPVSPFEPLLFQTTKELEQYILPTPTSLPQKKHPQSVFAFNVEDYNYPDLESMLKSWLHHRK